jgi:hypothetical protein
MMHQSVKQSTSWSSVEEYFSPPSFKMTDKHELILENTRHGNQWQQDMDRGFTEGECCKCFSRAGLYKDAGEFPAGAVNERLFPHALGMWVILKEADRLHKAYPKESQDLDRCGAFRALMMGEDVTTSDLISSGKAY